MIKIHYCLVCKAYLIKYAGEPLYEREVFSAPEIGQILGGN